MSEVTNNTTSTITVLGNFSQIHKEIGQLSTEIGLLNAQFQSFNTAAVGRRAAEYSTFKAAIEQTGAYKASLVDLTDQTDRFGKALDRQKLKLGQYTRELRNAYSRQSRFENNVDRLAQKRTRMLQSQVVDMGFDASGRRKAAVITPTTLDLNDFNTKTKFMEQRFAIMNKLMMDGSTQLINWGKNTQWAGRQLTVGLTVPLTIFAGVAAKAFMEVDKELTRFKRVYGDLGTTAEETARATDSVMRLAIQTAKDYGVAVKATVALSADLAASGYEGQKLLGATEQTNRLAILGETDRQEALKTTLALQSAFRMDTQQLADTINYLNAVENQTNLSLQDMTTGLPKAAPVIKALGGDIKDFATLMAAMKEGGVPASEAANAIKSGLASLVNPTKQTIQLMERWGIDLPKLIRNNSGDIVGTITALRDALSGLSDVDRTQALEQLFGKNQLARVTAMIENAGRKGTQSLTALQLGQRSAVENAGLAYKELLAVTESASGRFNRALQGFQAEILPLGEKVLTTVTPILEKAAQIFSKFADFFQSLPAPIREAVTSLAAFGAVAGPLIMISGTLANMAGYMGKLLTGLIIFQRKLRGIRNVPFAADLTDSLLASKGATDLYTESMISQTNALQVLNREMVEYRTNLAGVAAQNPQFLVGNAATGGTRRAPTRPTFLRRATGGFVPGTGDGDKVPAMLEPGEFVLRKKASKRLGSGLLNALNSGRIRGYQQGGFVEGVPRRPGAENEIINLLSNLVYALSPDVNTKLKNNSRSPLSGGAVASEFERMGGAGYWAVAQSHPTITATANPAEKVALGKKLGLDKSLQAVTDDIAKQLRGMDFVRDSDLARVAHESFGRVIDGTVGEIDEAARKELRVAYDKARRPAVINSQSQGPLPVIGGGTVPNPGRAPLFNGGPMYFGANMSRGAQSAQGYLMHDFANQWAASMGMPTPFPKDPQQRLHMAHTDLPITGSDSYIRGLIGQGVVGGGSIPAVDKAAMLMAGYDPSAESRRVDAKRAWISSLSQIGKSAEDAADEYIDTVSKEVSSPGSQQKVGKAASQAFNGPRAERQVAAAAGSTVKTYASELADQARRQGGLNAAPLIFPPGWTPSMGIGGSGVGGIPPVPPGPGAPWNPDDGPQGRGGRMRQRLGDWRTRMGSQGFATSASAVGQLAGMGLMIGGPMMGMNPVASTTLGMGAMLLPSMMPTMMANPMAAAGIVAATVAVGGLAYAYKKVNDELSKAKATAGGAFKQADESAKAFGTTLKSFDWSAFPGQGGKDEVELTEQQIQAVTKDYKATIDLMKSQAGPQLEGTVKTFYSNLIAQGFGAEQADAIIKEVAAQAGKEEIVVTVLGEWGGMKPGNATSGVVSMTQEGSASILGRFNRPRSESIAEEISTVQDFAVGALMGPDAPGWATSVGEFLLGGAVMPWVDQKGRANRIAAGADPGMAGNQFASIGLTALRNTANSPKTTYDALGQITSSIQSLGDDAPAATEEYKNSVIDAVKESNPALANHLESLHDIESVNRAIMAASLNQRLDIDASGLREAADEAQRLAWNTARVGMVSDALSGAATQLTTKIQNSVERRVKAIDDEIEAQEDRKEAIQEASEAQAEAAQAEIDAIEERNEVLEEKRDKQLKGLEKEKNQIEKARDATLKMLEAEQKRETFKNQQQKSKIDLATAISGGDMVEAAKIEADMAGNEASYNKDKAVDAINMSAEKRLEGIQQREEKINNAIDRQIKKNNERIEAIQKASEAQQKAAQESIKAIDKQIERERDLQTRIRETGNSAVQRIDKIVNSSKPLGEKMAEINKVLKNTNGIAGTLDAKQVMKKFSTNIFGALRAALPGVLETLGIKGMEQAPYGKWLNDLENKQLAKYSHGGGPVRTGGLRGNRAGRPMNAGLYRDEVPTVLQSGEFVVNKNAAQHYGADFLNSVNTRAYHDGGLVAEATGMKAASPIMSGVMTALFARKIMAGAMDQMVADSASSVGAAGLLPKSANAFVNAALKQLGVPYSWGGGGIEGPTLGIGRGAETIGFDCSGLVFHAANVAGIPVPRLTAEGYQDMSKAIPGRLSNPGDLVFFTKNPGEDAHHVGIVAGKNAMVNAPYTGANVRVDSINRPGEIIEYGRLPQLDSGAEVRKNNVIANLHNGEIVLTRPLSTDLKTGIARMAEGDNKPIVVKNEYNVELNVTEPGASAEEIGWKVVRKIEQRERSNNKRRTI